MASADIKRAATIFALVCALSAAAYFFQVGDPTNNLLLQALFFVGLPLAVAYFLKSPGAIGCECTDWIKGRYKIAAYTALIIVAAVPLVIYATRLPEFRAFYPLFRSGLTNLAALESYQLFSFLLLEFFFRGFALFQLRAALKNDWAAAVLQAVPYALIHLGKPPLELPFSFAAGIIFGLICLRARSFIPAWIGHWSAAFMLDWLLFYKVFI